MEKRKSEIIGAGLAIAITVAGFGYLCKSEKESQLAQFADFQNQASNAIVLLKQGNDESLVNAYNTARAARDKLRSIRISRIKNNDLDFLSQKAVDQLYSNCTSVMSNAEARLGYTPAR